MKCIFLLILCFCFTGCVSSQKPYLLPSQSIYNLTPGKDFEIISESPVYGTSYGILIFGLILNGNTGLIPAYERAVKKEYGANSLIDVKIDKSFYTFLGLISVFTTDVSGIPIKIIKTKHSEILQ